MQDKVNILIVDDQPAKLLALEVALESLNENLVKATSGREALRRMLDHEFAVILLDVNMPDMDGFETAAVIRQHPRCAQTPIIFVTAHSDDLLRQGYSLGAVDYMLSPIVPDILRTKVSVFVELFRKTEVIKRQAESEVALAREQAARLAAEDEMRRANFLADATVALSQCLESDQIVEMLVRNTVPRFCDFCAVAYRAGDGRLLQTYVGRREEYGGPTFGRCDDDELLPAALSDDWQAALDGRLTSPVVRQLHPQPSANGTPAAFREVVFLPLQAGEQGLGAICFGLFAGPRAFRPPDVATAKNLAARTTAALEKSALYYEIRENDRRKNEFLAMLAHELRNPLAPIRNAVELLRRPDVAAEHFPVVSEIIDRQIQQLVRLVDDLLDISRITRGKITLRRQPVEMNEIVDRAVEMSRPLMEARRQVVHLQRAPEPLYVSGDPVRLVQVLGNLLNNASKYTEAEGHVWVTAAAEADDVLIRVRDSGLGIPREMLESVFGLFVQVDRSLDRSQGGLGIGLTLVRTLVEMHGGRVRADSAGPNCGSEFVIALPRSSSAVVSTPTKSAGDDGEAADTNGKKRILVVDDNVDSALSLSMILKMRGHQTWVAHDGREALAAAEEIRPDWILLDIGLPGLDGYEVARQLRLNDDLRGAVLVAVTGYGRGEDVARSRDAGFDHHLVKPVDFKKLNELILNLEPSMQCTPCAAKS
jgi:signal transduction histidine kinase/PleD family two-component response regulator